MSVKWDVIEKTMFCLVVLLAVLDHTISYYFLYVEKLLYTTPLVESNSISKFMYDRFGWVGATIMILMSSLTSFSFYYLVKKLALRHRMLAFAPKLALATFIVVWTAIIANNIALLLQFA